MRKLAAILTAIIAFLTLGACATCAHEKIRLPQKLGTYDNLQSMPNS